MAKIIVKINKEGTKTTAKVEGVYGSGCQDLTKALEDRLGMVEEDQETEDMYLDQATETQELGL